jgi:acyl-CoA synthetase (AMP-forming)/AMP-acid ligase II
MVSKPAVLSDVSDSLTEYGPPGTVRTLSTLLRSRAAQQPDQIAYRVVRDSLFREDVLTYRDLHERALGAASKLQAEHLGGKRVALLHQTSVEFLAAFFGALYAGSVVVPLSVPWTAAALKRLSAILSDVDAGAVFTTQAIHDRVLQSSSATDWPAGQKFIHTEDLGILKDGECAVPDRAGLAVIQYTSGSTSTPKGVELSHGNFLHNAGLMAQASGLTAQSVGVNWLPLFHDMGLMGGVVQPLFTGFPVTLLSPAAFLARPVLWLQAMTRYRATVTGGPDFGYAHCTEMINDEGLEKLELSAWDVAYSGAEPVRAETLDRFAQRFARCGFNSRAFFPCYGLAEATLIVSGGPKEVGPVILEASRRSLEKNKMAVSASDQNDVVRLVSSGRPIGDQTVIIVDPDTRLKCDEGKIGEIWLRGPSVGSGYRNQAFATEEVFRARYAQHGDFLRTGDLGFIRDGNLFVVGRIKDLVIIHGVNHFPQDIELVAGESHPALRTGSGAAFAVESNGKEGLAIVYELKRNWRQEDVPDVLDGIRQAVANQHGIVPCVIVLVAQGTLHKTTSGKIQRHLAREAFSSGMLKVLAAWRPSETSEATQSMECDASAAEPTGGPPDDLHTLLMGIWSEILKIDDIGIEDNFFDIGGQSSQLVSVHLKLNQILNVDVPVTKLFQYPTIRSLSGYLQGVDVPAKVWLRQPGQHNDVRGRVRSRGRYYRFRLGSRKSRGVP